MSYTKQTWATGDVITAEKLNHMEDGIEDAGSGGGSSEPISITYSALKALRNNNSLTPGAQYRITDYVCTVMSELASRMRAVSHPFDIIVTALTESTISKAAKACLHEGDTYYSASSHNVDLSRWELEYDIDDTMYSDPQNGKGWITYMKDDNDNECPYDFKQIQFPRYKILASEAYLVDFYTSYNYSPLITQIDETPKWFYTFSFDDTPNETNLEDASVVFYQDEYGKFYRAHRNKTGDVDNVFYLRNNSEAGMIRNNSLGRYSYGNTFHDITVCNTIGESCTGIVTDNYFSNNTINDSSCVLASSHCLHNTIGCNCQDLIMNGDCDNNCIDLKCLNITLSQAVKNHHIFSGVSGTSSAQLVINPVTGDPVTFVCKNSSGTVKTWNPADLAP